jgi:hypothetical protein
MLGVPEHELRDYTPQFNIAPTQPYFVLKTWHEPPGDPGDLGPVKAHRNNPAVRNAISLLAQTAKDRQANELHE